MAKVISRSPMRPNAGHIAIKNTLDAPFKSKWPKLSRAVIAEILEEVKRSLCGIKVKSVRKKRRKVPHKLDSDDVELSEPLAKRQRLDKGNDSRQSAEETPVEKEEELIPVSEDHESTIDIAQLEGESVEGTIKMEEVPSPDVNLQSEKQQEKEEVDDKDAGEVKEQSSNIDPVQVDSVDRRKDHLVLGINGVTRLLEQRRLVAGLVCSSSPSLLHQHLLPLAAMGEVPFAAVPDLSGTISQCLGIKRAVCMGIKKSCDGSNPFSPLCDKISGLVKPIYLPWMKLSKCFSLEPHSVQTEGIDSPGDFKDNFYHSLQIKKLKNQPKKAKKHK